jgi:hypothetical protein
MVVGKAAHLLETGGEFMPKLLLVACHPRAIIVDLLNLFE